jgi:hypothetical protein
MIPKYFKKISFSELFRIFGIIPRILNINVTKIIKMDEYKCDIEYKCDNNVSMSAESFF